MNNRLTGNRGTCGRDWGHCHLKKHCQVGLNKKPEFKESLMEIRE